MRRRGGDGWAYQGFNYPKSVWGGQLKAQMRKLEGEERADALQGDRRHQHPDPQALAGADARGAAQEGWYRTVTRARSTTMEPGPQRHRAGRS